MNSNRPSVPQGSKDPALPPRKRASEGRRALKRMITNYTSLGINVLIGLAWTRILFVSMGQEGLGLILLLGSAAGIGYMIQEVTKSAIVREVGTAYHDPDPDAFPTAYNSALVLCMKLAGFTAICFAAIALVLGLLRIGPDLIGAARIMILCVGITSVATVVTAPLINMFNITERFGWANSLLVARRIANLLSALLAMWLSTHDHSVGFLVIVYTITNNSISLLIIGFSTVAILRMQPELVPDLRLGTRAGQKAIVAIGGWNLLVLLAVNLHLRVDQFIVNIFTGLQGNMIFGIGVQFTSYARRVTMGMTDGLDAVAVRLSSGQRPKQMDELLRHSTRLHGLIAFPALWCFLVLVDVLYPLWLGPRLLEIENLDRLFLTSYLLLGGIIARGISDGWVRVFYGAGYVRSYAPFILAGGIINPLLAVGLSFALPEHLRIIGPAISYTAIMTTVHFIVVPVVCSRASGIPLSAILTPLLRPLLASMLAAPVLLGVRLVLGTSWMMIIAGVAAFGVVYFVACMAFVFSREDYALIKRALRG